MQYSTARRDTSNIKKKKGCRQLFRSYITTFPFVPPLSEYILRLLSQLVDPLSSLVAGYLFSHLHLI
ncbi:hypothetical protein I308_100784 [Cryptococcus tetragattii IND107]|uniref:Uncharacterized protein n=1 Tax=Cryptococcus tetragattii IND107 TaxID=1296105 RepID=A0ABR3C5S3_9TREE